MTDQEILQQKVNLFSFDEILDKLIEELSEAMHEALDLRYSRGTNKGVYTWMLIKLIKELADVDVAGRRTLAVIPDVPNFEFDAKSRYAVQSQIRAANEKKRAEGATTPIEVDDV